MASDCGTPDCGTRKVYVVDGVELTEAQYEKYKDKINSMASDESVAGLLKKLVRNDEIAGKRSRLEAEMASLEQRMKGLSEKLEQIKETYAKLSGEE